MEKIFNGDSQSIAQLLDGRYRCAIVSSADDVVHRRLCNSTHRAQLVDRNIIFSAQFYDPFLPILPLMMIRYSWMLSPFLEKAYRKALEKINSFGL